MVWFSSGITQDYSSSCFLSALWWVRLRGLCELAGGGTGSGKNRILLWWAGPCSVKIQSVVCWWVQPQSLPVRLWGEVTQPRVSRLRSRVLMAVYKGAQPRGTSYGCCCPGLTSAGALHHSGEVWSSPRWGHCSVLLGSGAHTTFVCALQE